MKYSLKTIEIISLIAACILGPIFHSMYSWSGENPVAGLFFPVNESTWEHLKIIFFPVLVVSIWEYFILRERYKNFICVKFLSVLVGMAATIVMFYTYQGVYGKNSDVMNILIYFVSVGAAYFFSYRMLSRQKLSDASDRSYYFAFVTMTLLFVTFSVFPPHFGLFAPPI